MRFAVLIARLIYMEAADADDEELAKTLAGWATKSASRQKLEAMIALARSQPGVAVTPGQLDSDRWAFNVENGTLDLRTGKLQQHAPQALITKMAPVAYDANAKCPLWHRFLDRIFEEKEALIRYVQQVLGVSLTGDIREQYLYIFHGEGNNGKNVLLDTVSGLMGDYACEAPPDLVTQSHCREHPTEIADLCGRRLVIATETEEGSALRLQLIKRLTGNARLKGRFMRQDYFEFDRTHKLVLLTNNKPVVNEKTEATWRRLRLVPFDVVMPPEERDKDLINRLKGEWPGILAWLVRGCLDWISHGLIEPNEVRTATSSYRTESDTFQQFLDECCDLGAGLWTSSAKLRSEYESWMRGRGQQPLKGKGFIDCLKRHGCSPKKVCGERGWLGIGLK